jgi:23S rRNA pseudouridine1911/1915/1917 synthase
VSSDSRPLSPESLIWPQSFTVAAEQAGQRLDVFVTEQFATFSRANVRRAIDAGHVKVDGARCKPSWRLETGSQVEVAQIDVPREGPSPQNIPLHILHEDDDIVVVNKPAGMVVHPAKGHWEGTLASALAYHFGTLSGRGGPTRPGIVHRLDRDTSGVIVVAKHDRAHDALAEQFKSREVSKEYLAIVVGVPQLDRDLIDEPIGDHPTHPDKKAIRRTDPEAKPAQTIWEVVERFNGYTLVRALPKTGRTHQIRLHLTHIRHSILCDRLYGGRSVITELELIPRDKLAHYTAEERTAAEQSLLERQALHAHRLAFNHPTTGEPVQFDAPLPADIERVLAALRHWRGK